MSASTIAHGVKVGYILAAPPAAAPAPAALQLVDYGEEEEEEEEGVGVEDDDEGEGDGTPVNERGAIQWTYQTIEDRNQSGERPQAGYVGAAVVHEGLGTGVLEGKGGGTPVPTLKIKLDSNSEMICGNASDWKLSVTRAATTTPTPTPASSGLITWVYGGSGEPTEYTTEPGQYVKSDEYGAGILDGVGVGGKLGTLSIKLDSEHDVRDFRASDWQLMVS
jgi:hypothetical protein